MADKTENKELIAAKISEEDDKLRELTPDEYFEYIKGKKVTITDADLLKFYDNCLRLLDKYRVTGQTAGMRKLIFHFKCIEKERDIVAMGVNTFIYRDDIEEYIDNIANDAVKIIEIENYEREIPDEIVDVVDKVKGKFDQLYVLFTDYTGKVGRRVKKDEYSRDPILFGTFQDTESRTVIDRFYYLGSWIDEYCDLTLDKMVNEVKEAKHKDITRKISTPEDVAELEKQLGSLEKHSDSFRIVETAKIDGKKHFFNNIKTFFGNKK